MYEAIQNKEKVSRRIDGGEEKARQRVKIGNINNYKDSAIQSVIQCEPVWLYGASEADVSDVFNKGIPDSEDDKLCKKIEEIKDTVSASKQKILLYVAVGTANASANKTNPSAGIFVNKNNIRRQQKPEIINNVGAEYQPIVLNIDQFGYDDKEHFNGLFPLSGKTNTNKNAKSIEAFNGLFNLIYEKEGIVILVNAVEDSKDDGDHSKFRAYKGFTNLFPTNKEHWLNNFVFATSYLQQYQNFDIYKKS